MSTKGEDWTIQKLIYENWPLRGSLVFLSFQQKLQANKDLLFTCKFSGYQQYLKKIRSENSDTEKNSNFEFWNSVILIEYFQIFVNIFSSKRSDVYHGLFTECHPMSSMKMSFKTCLERVHESFMVSHESSMTNPRKSMVNIIL